MILFLYPGLPLLIPAPISGSLCAAWGIIMFIFLPDSPVTAKGLTKREKRIAVDRIRENQTGVENKHLKPYQILEAAKDYKLYLFFTLGVVCMSPRIPDLSGETNY